MKKLILAAMCCLLVAGLLVSCDPTPPEVKTYSVKWCNEDGTVLKTDTVQEGAKPAYTGETPTKASTAEFSYAFDGWDKEVVPASADATYTAKFTATKRTYTVTWKNHDGSVLGTSQVEYGATPSYTGDAPAKESTAENTFAFNCWTPELAAVSGDAEYTATFTASKRSYTITWKNHDGSVLETDTVEYGATPTYDGDAPTKARTAEFTYTFTGWDKAVSAVTADATYTAAFSAAKNSYTVTWKNHDGSVLETDTVEYGILPTFDGTNPTKTDDARATYTFNGWDKSITTVTGDVTYTAQYSETIKKYNISWVDGNGNTIKVDSVEYGATPAYTGTAPTQNSDAQNDYTFNGQWLPEIVPVTGNKTYTAQFSANVRVFTITWKNYDGTVLGTSQAEYGSRPTYTGDTPVKPEDEGATYTHVGWSPIVDAVTGDITLTAQFSNTFKKYIITFLDTDGTTVLESKEVNYGAMPFYTGKTLSKEETAQYRYEYRWDKEVVLVTGNTTYTAVLVPILRSYEISWLDENNNLLEITTVNYGETPVYPKANPTKATDSANSYTFAGWSPALSSVTGTKSYKATFNAIPRQYTIQWVDGDGNVIHSKTLPYGTVVGAYDGPTPTKTATAQFTYSFSMWDDNDFPTYHIVTDRTITAEFNSTVNKYTISYYQEDGTTLISSYANQPYGQLPTQAILPSKAQDAQYTYTAAWDRPVETVTGDTSYKVVFTPHVRSYTIKFLCDGNELQSETLVYGTMPVYKGETPTRASTVQYEYRFTGWDSAISSVTGDARYYAQFQQIDMYAEYFNYYQSGSGYMLSSLKEAGKTKTSLVIPPMITDMSDVFKDNKVIESVTLPDGLSYMAQNGFRGCSSLRSIVIPDSVTYLESFMFYECTSLESAVIPGGITNFGSHWFYGCTNLTSVTIKEGLTTIPSNAFNSCFKLATIVIPNGVTSLSSGAFAWCSGLTTITIPNTVTSMGAITFYRCANLTTINFTGTKAQWEAISKDASWDNYADNYTVHCTDGDIAK